MQVTSTNPLTSSSSSKTSDNSSSSKETALPQQTLNMQDFLTLLVKQMTSQDPMNPQSDTDFIAQMAQFSSLQQATTMQTEMSKMSSSQSMTQASSMIGQTVTLQIDSKTTAQGVVSAVNVQAGTPKLVINGQNYDLSQVIAVSPTTPNSSN